DVLYVPLKLLWGLMEQKTMPGPPSQESIKEFHSCFSNADMIETAAADEGAPTIIPFSEVVSLASLKAGRKKVGQGLVNIKEFHLTYLKATLACLGIHKHANKLHSRLPPAVVGCAYAYMNVDPKYAGDLGLLIPTYNHYVYFLQSNQYQREKKEVGKFC
ncbi:hypothetical protein VP01_10572g1, partial [Puccinia sorghi]